MATIIVGARVGKNGRLGVGCSASIFDVNGEKVLLVRRADNGGLFLADTWRREKVFQKLASGK